MVRKLVLSLMIATTTMAVMPIAASAEWKQTQDNTWTWQEKGKKAIGWKYIDDSWYYFGKDGEMVTGWLQDQEDDKWYYLWSDGTMANSTWLWNGGLWYYFDASGEMVLDSAQTKFKQDDLDQTTMLLSTNMIRGNQSTSVTTTSAGAVVK